MADTDWGAFTDASTLLLSDVFVASRSGAGINFNAFAIAHRDASGSLRLGGGSYLPGDGDYVGVGAYYNAGWKNSVTGQGGGAVVNVAGSVAILTGSSPGTAGSVISDMAERFKVNGAGFIGINTAPSSTGRLNIVSGSGKNGIELVTSGLASNLALIKDAALGAYLTLISGATTVGSITTNGTSTSYNTSSDYRLKEDLKPVTGALDRLMTLKPVNFAWKANGERTDGFLAHEFGEVIPGAATGQKDATRSESYVDVGTGKKRTRKVPEYQGIDQSKAVPLLVAALQEAVKRIEELEARL